MQDIARAGGMSAANLYRFYDGKHAIGAAVATAEQRELLAGCDRAIAAAPGGTMEKMTALFLALIDGTRRQIRTTPLLFDLSVTVARRHPGVRQRLLVETEARIIGILAASAAPGLQSPDERTAAGRMILMAGAPFVLPWLLLNEPFGNPRPMVGPLIRRLVSGLEAT